MSKRSDANDVRLPPIWPLCEEERHLCLVDVDMSLVS